MKAETPGAITAPANASPGAQVLYQWAEWLRQRGFPRAARLAYFHKEEDRLVVHEYPTACAVLKIGSQKPKIQEFREWRQPFDAVVAKLRARGWFLDSSTGSSSTGNAVKAPTTWQQVTPPAVIAYAVPHIAIPLVPKLEVSHAAH